MNIMIIEDDRIQSTGLKLQLAQLGYTDVTVVDNGISAHKNLGRTRFDLIFCDIRMPQMDGITLLSEYVTPNDAKGVIIMSAVDDNILEITRGMCNLNKFDFVEVLKKPFDINQLSNIVDSFNNFTAEETREAELPTLSDKDIEEAFEKDRVIVHYQPQFDFRTGQLIGVEALARITHDQYGVVAPDRFLTQVEDLGMLDKLYNKVLDISTEEIASISTELRLSVNINRQLLEEQDVCNYTLVTCQKNGFMANKLTLELTEDQTCDGTPAFYANLARLRLNDVELAIDDFGTGYASLDQLIDLPFTELKIDRNFIHGIANDYRRQQLASMALQLAQGLGLTCVAEGVEDQATWEFLRELGIDVCQGYYTGKPMLLSEIKDLDDLFSSKVVPSISESYTLFLDTRTQESSATLKLLLKEEALGHIVSVESESEMVIYLRDLPINNIITHSEAFQSGHFNVSQHLPMYPDVKIFLLESSSLDSSTEGLDNVLRINKSKSLYDTIQSVLVAVGGNKTESLDDSQHYAQLSKRELDVAKLLVAGFTNKYISYELGINQKTVSTYKTRILTKLGIKSTVELVKVLNSST
ncbi:EAL domain-containing protein [Vibrio campbellii]|uniref:EAL domain-containing protein n=1 Tax=Vibrio campbellii TaxID=680 RepID=UPI0038574332